MEELQLAVNDFIDTRYNESDHDMTEEDILVAVLMQISNTKQFSQEHRRVARQWINDVSKPSRHRNRNRLIGKKRAAALAGQENTEVFSETDDEEEGKPKIKSFTSFGGTGYLCACCEKEGCGWFCMGPCRRAWHTKCKNKDLDITHGTELPDNEEEDLQTVLKRMEKPWICNKCKKNDGTCYACGQTAKYADSEKTAKSRKAKVIRCQLPSCGKCYHAACAKKFIKKNKLTCAQHYCDKCGELATSKVLMCIRCPKSYHINCTPVKTTRLNQKYILCPEHRQPSTITKYPSQSKEMRNKLKENADAIKSKLRENAQKFTHLMRVEEIVLVKKKRSRPATKKEGKPVKKPKIEPKDSNQHS